MTEEEEKNEAINSSKIKDYGGTFEMSSTSSLEIPRGQNDEKDSTTIPDSPNSTISQDKNEILKLRILNNVLGMADELTNNDNDNQNRQKNGGEQSKIDAHAGKSNSENTANEEIHQNSDKMNSLNESQNDFVNENSTNSSSSSSSEKTDKKSESFEDNFEIASEKENENIQTQNQQENQDEHENDNGLEKRKITVLTNDEQNVKNSEKNENSNLERDEIDNQFHGGTEPQVKEAPSLIDHVENRAQTLFSTPEKNSSLPKISNPLSMTAFSYFESPNHNDDDYSSSSSDSTDRNRTTPRKRNSRKGNSPAFITADEDMSLKNEGDFKSVRTLQLNNQFTQEDIHEAFDNLIKYKALPSEDMAGPLMNFINRKRIDSLCTSDYDNAKKMDQAVNMIIQGENQIATQKFAEARKDDLKRRHEHMKQNYKDRVKYWNIKIDEIRDEGENKMKWLEDKQSKEVNEFKAKWQSPEFIRTFNRPSTRLLQLRHIEKKLAITRDYDGAKRTKKIADHLQSQEEKAMQQTIENRMKIEYTKLREKHLSELNKMEAFYQFNENELRHKMKKDLDAIQLGLKAMEVKKEVPITKRTMIHSRKATLSAIPEKHNPSSAIPTPRTRVRYTHYRVEKAGELNLSPVDDEKISMLPSSPVRRRKRPQSSVSSRFPKL